MNLPQSIFFHELSPECERPTANFRVGVDTVLESALTRDLCPSLVRSLCFTSNKYSAVENVNEKMRAEGRLRNKSSSETRFHLRQRPGGSGGRPENGDMRGGHPLDLSSSIFRVLSKTL
jgi:hypothetical protein